jgi:hypothetical protein
MYIRVKGRDNVAIVVSPDGVSPGDVLPGGLTARETIPQAHKIALTDFGRGEAVVRYGQPCQPGDRPRVVGAQRVSRSSHPAGP